ncbi:MAG: hypothetical protein GVY19_03635 [Bacteroidetes bacterium]|jgi:Flp pilus assembly protein TadD|nr:hypothetical protein [Bacteroidota bacterium]
MKKLGLKISFVLVASIVISSCGGINKMKETANEVDYSVTPEVLEAHGGEVEVTIRTRFPEKYFHKKAVLTATPVLKYEGGQAEYESTTLQGEAVEANNKVIAQDGGEYSTSGSVAYTEDMRESELVMSMTASVGDNSVEIQSPAIARGVVATSTLVEVDPKTVLVGDNFERITSESYGADIHFVINRSNVRRSELTAEDVKALEAKIEEAKGAERKEFKGVSVEAYASPDGEYDFNEELAGDRKNAAKGYLDRQFRNVEKSDMDEFFSLMSTAEDWEGFKELMQQSDIEDKELILRVLSMHSDPQVREREIRNISEAFEEIAEKILPELRRSKMNVNFELIGYSDEEITELVQSKPDTLNEEEILYAASLFDDNQTKLDIYQTAADQFPESFRAINNVGHIQYLMGDYDAAKASFEEAKGIEDNDIVNNNLGAIALRNGDMEKAEELLTAAMGTGEVANYNLGIIKIKEGNYTDAVSYFGNSPSFNAALAQTLNGDNDKAIGTLNSIEAPDAMTYYLWAVVGARAQQEEMVYTNLRNAVGKDPSLKSFAAGDLEFRMYTGNETFQSIVE